MKIAARLNCHAQAKVASSEQDRTPLLASHQELLPDLDKGPNSEKNDLHRQQTGYRPA